MVAEVCLAKFVILHNSRIGEDQRYTSWVFCNHGRFSHAELKATYFSRLESAYVKLET